MKKLVILLIAAVTSAYALPTIPGPVFKIPPEIQAITDVDSLRKLLSTLAHDDRVPISMRLGEIGGEAELPLLIETYNREPYTNATEVLYYFKYYTLLSIGQIGGPTAEQFLREIINTISPTIKARTNSFTRADSLGAIAGAIEGLGEIGTPSVGAFLDSVFQNSENTLSVREIAYREALKLKLKHNPSLITAADTANFLLDEWNAVPWARTPFTAAGVSADYIIRNNIEALLYQYRSITLPYVTALEGEMNPDDPKTAALAALKKRMIDNPPGRDK